MSVTFGSITFNTAAYDAQWDTLDLGLDGVDAVDFDLSEEADQVRLAADGSIVGLSINDALWRLNRDGQLVVTLQSGTTLESPDVAEFLRAGRVAASL